MADANNASPQPTICLNDQDLSFEDKVKVFRINRRIQDNVVLSERDLFEGVQDLMHVVVRLKVHQQHRKSDISSGSAPGNRSELGGENDSLTHHPFEQIYRLEELEPLVVPLLLVLVEPKE